MDITQTCFHNILPKLFIIHYGNIFRFSFCICFVCLFLPFCTYLPEVFHIYSYFFTYKLPKLFSYSPTLTCFRVDPI